MKPDKLFNNELEDTIKQRGPMYKFFIDSIQDETTGRMKYILRGYIICNWSSEPNEQQQNPAECKCLHIKYTTNYLMERTSSPVNTWLIALMYTCHLLNYEASSQLDLPTPIECFTGVTPDISPFLRFHWYKPVYYVCHYIRYKSVTRETEVSFLA